MLKSMTNVMHGIERFLDLMPEPLVLRAMDTPERSAGRTGR
jgi:hypothetical protein